MKAPLRAAILLPAGLAGTGGFSLDVVRDNDVLSSGDVADDSFDGLFGA